MLLLIWEMLRYNKFLVVGVLELSVFPVSIPYPNYPLHCKCGYQPHCMGPNLIYQ